MLCRNPCRSRPPLKSQFLDLDKMVTKVKENVYERSHVIVRLIEEANIGISSLKTELEHAKKPDAIVNGRTSTMHAVPCVSFFRLALLGDGCGKHHTS